MTIRFNQVSILDYPQVTANARYSVEGPSAESVAQSQGLLPERSFDDLDYFDIFAVKCGDVVLGFRTYRGAPGGSLVSIWPREAPNVIDLIVGITGVSPHEISMLSEPM